MLGISSPVSEKLRKNIPTIMTRWEALVRQVLLVGRGQSRPILYDHIPAFLERLADALADLNKGEKSKTAAHEHGKQRAELWSYSLENVIQEYYLLRKVTLEVLEELDPLETRERNFILDWISDAIVHSTTSFVKERKSEKAELDRRLAETLNLLEGWMKACPVGLAFIDSEYRYQRVNLAFSEINDLPEEQLIGQDVRHGLKGLGSFLSEWIKLAFESGKPVLNQEVITSFANELKEKNFWLLNIYPVRRSESDQSLLGLGIALVDVTQLRLAQEAVKQSEDRLRTVMNTIPQLIWEANAFGKVLMMSQRWLDYTGSKLEENLGSGWLDFVHPADVSKVYESMLRAANSKKIYEVEYRLRRADGIYEWHLARGYPVRSEGGELYRWIGTTTNIHEQKLRENYQALLAETSEALSSSLDYAVTLRKVAGLTVKHLADWCMIDLLEDGKMKRVAVAHVDPRFNPLTQELESYLPDPGASTGASKAFLLQKSLIVPQPSEGARELAEDQLGFLDAQDQKQVEIIKRLGVSSYLVVLLKLQETIAGAIILVSADPTRLYDEKDLEFAEELAKRAAGAIDRAQLYKKAQEAIAARDDMISIVSHDLKNPLSAILLNTTLMIRSGQFGADEVMRIQHAAEKMQYLIEDILSMARIESGIFTVDRKLDSPTRLFAEIVQIFRPIAGEKKIQLRTEVIPEDVTLYCDHERILQVLSNLVSNAIRYSPVGTEVRLRARHTPEGLRFSVSDQGSGIDSKSLPFIFEKYWQIREQGSNSGGTGLGLFIAKGIVEAHRGRIWAESDLSKGTAIHFILPFGTEGSSAEAA